MPTPTSTLPTSMATPTFTLSTFSPPVLLASDFTAPMTLLWAVFAMYNVANVDHGIMVVVQWPRCSCLIPEVLLTLHALREFELPMDTICGGQDVA